MSSNHQPAKATAIGINHVALEVGDIDQALEFYGQFLSFEIQSKNDNSAFIYFGDQFINFAKSSSSDRDRMRHFGIAVDDKELVRETLLKMGITITQGRMLDFHDPWGNQVEITTYTKIQFSKADHVLDGMGMGHLQKDDDAIAELSARGLAPKPAT